MNTRLEAHIADREADRGKFEDAMAKMELAGWVYDLCPWDVISHLTYAWSASIWSAQRCYEKFMAQEYPRLSYFYALEANPSRDGFHAHALWGDAGGVYRKEAWAKWHQRFGRARIEPVRCLGDVTDYCAKYVTKAGAWWNAKLQWHRIQALHDRGFVLRSSDSPA